MKRPPRRLRQREPGGSAVCQQRLPLILADEERENSPRIAQIGEHYVCSRRDKLTFGIGSGCDRNNPRSGSVCRLDVAWGITDDCRVLRAEGGTRHGRAARLCKSHEVSTILAVRAISACVENQEILQVESRKLDHRVLGDV